MELFPGVPADVGLECLIRIPYDNFSSVSSVCKSWKFELEMPEFLHQRKVSGQARRVIVMAQTRFDPNRKFDTTKHWSVPVYRLTLYEPETGNWRELPPVPDYSDGLPMFCQLVGVGYNLVVLGGWNPTTWMASNAVFVYSFLSGTWRRGADMPGGPRSFFSCASDDDRTVLVAGGHDNTKNALKSAIMYDLDNDRWVLLPDMAEGRDECKAVFHRGMFHVIGGYHTETQGRFEKSAEAFDVVNWEWNQVEQNFLETATCPRTCVGDGDGAWYMCLSDMVVARFDSSWQVIAALPPEVVKTSYMIGWRGNLLVIGAPKFGEPYEAYVLDLKSSAWRRVDKADQFSGHVQSSCCLEI